MPTSTEIGTAGESAAVAALKGKGWTISRWDTKAPGSTDIEAVSGNSKLLVQVKAAVHPQAPASLSNEEERNIKSRAAKIGASAYEAKVTLNADLTLLNSEWRQLM